ncbi:MAG: hypothetical protein WCQ16_09470 [Verrucomicrobiae bacterium]
MFHSVDLLAGDGRHDQILGLFQDQEKCEAEIRQDRSIFRRALEVAIHALATDSSPKSHSHDLADLIRMESDFVDDTRRLAADHLRQLFSKRAISPDDVRLFTGETDNLHNPDFEIASMILLALIAAANTTQDSSKAMLGIWFARAVIRLESCEHPSRFIMDFVIQHFDLLGPKIALWLTEGTVFQVALVRRLIESGFLKEAFAFASEFQEGESFQVVEEFARAGHHDLARKYIGARPTNSKADREHVEKLKQTLADFDPEEEVLLDARLREASGGVIRPVPRSVLRPIPVCDLLLGDNNVPAAIAAWVDPGPDLGKELKQQFADTVKKCLAKALANPSDASLGNDLAACAGMWRKLAPQIVPPFVTFYFVAEELSGLSLLPESFLSENFTSHFHDARNVAHILTHGSLGDLLETDYDVEEAFTSRVRAYNCAAEIMDSVLNDRKKACEWLDRATVEILEFIPEWQPQDSTYDVLKCLEQTVGLAIEMMSEASSTTRALAEVYCK